MTLAAVAPADALDFRPSGAIAVGVIGPNQYDQGKARGMLAATFVNFWQPSDSWSIGGLGLGFRASNGIYQGLSELGLSIPVVTHRHGIWMQQAGILIQRGDLQKNAFFVGFGMTVPTRSRSSRR
jgi:hypothetical protein